MQSQPNYPNTTPIKLYFTQDQVCLGSVNDYYGDYYASEVVQLYPNQAYKGRTLSEITIERSGIFRDRLKKAKTPSN